MRHRFLAVIIAGVLLVIVVVYNRPFVSPLATSQVFLPLVLKSRRFVPDGRFGIAEHNLAQMLLLGFPDDGRYHSVQHEQPEETDTVRFLRPASRDPANTWQIGAYDTDSGRWSDEIGFRQFVRDHDGMAYIIGNELSLGTPIGDSHVTPDQYARWYRDAWALIKSENPTALVGPFGPVTWSTKLIPVWDAYIRLTGKPMLVDFYPVHRYMWPGQTPGEWWEELVDWITWLESYRDRAWAGPRVYWLNEFGLPEWKYSDWVTPEKALNFMADVVPRLKENNLGVTVWAWWPSGGDTTLIRGVNVTDLGRLYLKLALE